MDSSLILQCSATIGVPMTGGFNLGWAWFDHARPPYAVVPLSQGGIVTITHETSVQCCESSSLTIDNFSSSLFANKTIACFARNGIVIDVETFEVKPCKLYCKVLYIPKCSPCSSSLYSFYISFLKYFHSKLFNVLRLAQDHISLQHEGEQSTRARQCVNYNCVFSLIQPIIL